MTMNEAALRWTRRDLIETIAIQEDMVRRAIQESGAANVDSSLVCPKLNQYVDEFYAVCGEMHRRGLA